MYWKMQHSAAILVMSENPQVADSSVAMPSVSAQHDVSTVDTPSVMAPAPPVNTLESKAVDFKLSGVFLTDRNSSAVITDVRGNESIVHVGDVINGSWSMDMIYHDRVVVSGHGLKATVRLASPGSIGYPQKQVEESPLSIDEIKIQTARKRMQDPDFQWKLARYLHGRHPTQVEYPVGVDSYGIHADSPTHFEVDREAVLEQFYQAKFYRHIKYVEHSDGIAIEEVVPGSLFDKLGIQAGDRITAIDGKTIDTIAALLSSHMELIYGEKFAVDLVRQENPLTLSLVLK